MQLKLSTRTVGDVLVVDCNGKIVFGEESATLRDAVKRLIEEKNTQLVLNLAGVNYIDSGGLGTLVGSVHDRAERRRIAEVGQLDAAGGRLVAGHETGDDFRSVRQ